MIKNFIRIVTVIGLLITISQAQAEPFIFSGTATGGSVDYDGDGFSDGTWSITNTGQNTESSFFPTAGGVGFEFKGGGNWTLNSVFNVILTDPDITYQLTLVGNNTSGADYGSKFVNYNLSWTGGSGNATTNAPDPTEIINVTNGVNSINFDQGTNTTPTNSPSSGKACTTSTGAIRNDCLDWSVLLPAGATNLNMTATDGKSLEGFLFSLTSYADLKVSKTVSAASIAENDTGYFEIDVENIATPGFSAAVGTTLTDLLPSDVTYSTHSITSSTSANLGGTYNSGSGEWDIGKISQGEAITNVSISRLIQVPEAIQY